MDYTDLKKAVAAQYTRNDWVSLAQKIDLRPGQIESLTSALDVFTAMEYRNLLDENHVAMLNCLCNNNVQTLLDQYCASRGISCSTPHQSSEDVVGQRVSFVPSTIVDPYIELKHLLIHELTTSQFTTLCYAFGENVDMLDTAVGRWSLFNQLEYKNVMSASDLTKLRVYFEDAHLEHAVTLVDWYTEDNKIGC